MCKTIGVPGTKLPTLPEFCAKAWAAARLGPPKSAGRQSCDAVERGVPRSVSEVMNRRLLACRRPDGHGSTYYTVPQIGIADRSTLYCYS
jgi:hypothetical protein